MDNGGFSSQKPKKHVFNFSCMGMREDKAKLETNIANEQANLVARLEAKGARVLKTKRRVVKDNPPGTLSIVVTIYYEALSCSDPIRAFTDDMIDLGIFTTGQMEKLKNTIFTADIITEKLLFKDPLNDFISKFLKQAPGEYALQDEVYKAYFTFCRKQAKYPLTKEVFSEQIKKELLVKEDRIKAGWKKKRAWGGISLMRGC